MTASQIKSLAQEVLDKHGEAILNRIHDSAMESTANKIDSIVPALADDDDMEALIEVLVQRISIVVEMVPEYKISTILFGDLAPGQKFQILLKDSIEPNEYIPIFQKIFLPPGLSGHINTIDIISGVALILGSDTEVEDVSKAPEPVLKLKDLESGSQFTLVENKSLKLLKTELILNYGAYSTGNCIEMTDGELMDIDENAEVEVIA